MNDNFNVRVFQLYHHKLWFLGLFSKSEGNRNQFNSMMLIMSMTLQADLGCSSILVHSQHPPGNYNVQYSTTLRNYC